MKTAIIGAKIRGDQDVEEEKTMELKFRILIGKYISTRSIPLSINTTHNQQFSYKYFTMEIDHPRIQSLNMAVKYNTKIISEDTAITSKPPSHSISGLAKILRKKNQTYQEERENNKSYTAIRQDLQNRASIPKAEQLHQLAQNIKTKGVQFIKSKQIVEDHTQQWLKLNNQFWFDDLTISNQGRYLTAHNQFFIKKTIGDSIQSKKYSKMQSQIKQQNLNKINKKKDTQGQHEQPTKTMLSTRQHKMKAQRKEENHKIYLNYVKKMIISDQGISNVDGFIKLSNCEFWEIINAQLKNYQYAAERDKEHPEIGIVLASLKMIENEFKKNLMDTQEGINHMIEKNYVDSDNKKLYLMDQKKQYKWGLIYIYYKSGLFAKFLSKLSENGRHGTTMRKAFEQLQSSIDIMSPTAQELDQDNISDPFYKQLVCLVRGQMYFSSPVLGRINTLDFVWLVLRLIQLFFYEQNSNRKNLNRQKAFKEVIKKLEQQLKKQQSDTKSKTQTLHNLLYLNAYDSLINLNQDQEKKLMKQQDYLHLLLVLYFHPELLEVGTSDLNNTIENIEQELKKSLVKQIQQMMKHTHYRQYAIYYILLIPAKMLNQSLPQLFTQLNHFEIIEKIIIEGVNGWQYIQYKIQHFDQGSYLDEFNFAIQNIFTLMVQQEKDSLKKIKIIQKAQQYFIENRQFFYTLLLKSFYDYLLLQSQRQGTQSDNFLSSYLALSNQIQAEQSQYIDNHFYAFKFINDYCRAEELIRLSNINLMVEFLEIEDFVKNLEHLLPDVDIDTINNSVLVDLIVLLQGYGSMILVQKYFHNVVKIAVTVYNRRGRYPEADQFKKRINRLINKICGHKGNNLTQINQTQLQKSLKRIASDIK